MPREKEHMIRHFGTPCTIPLGDVEMREQATNAFPQCRSIDAVRLHDFARRKKNTNSNNDKTYYKRKNTKMKFLCRRRRRDESESRAQSMYGGGKMYTGRRRKSWRVRKKLFKKYVLFARARYSRGLCEQKLLKNNYRDEN